MDKIVHVPAYFKKTGENVLVDVPTGEIKKGFLGGEKKVTKKESQFKVTGESDCIVDSKRLADDLSKVVNELNNSGFNVTAITPVISGHYDTHQSCKSSGLGAATPGQSYGVSFAYGYRYTDSLIVVASKA